MTFKNFFKVFSFSCRHRHLSQPFSVTPQRSYARNEDWDPVDGGGSALGSHYVVCLDCGHRYAYDWQNMRVIKGTPRHA